MAPSRRLHAWLEGRFVGVFDEHPDGSVSFAYADTAPSTPVSLSLPRNGGWSRNVPMRFLDNLLPDNAQTRKRIAGATGAQSAGVVDLLSVIGHDVSGGLVLDRREEAPSLGQAAPPVPVSDDEIAYRIAILRDDPDAWMEPGAVGVRFSLAGAQAKFALATIDGKWFKPSAQLPSTHIFKPAYSSTREIDVIEMATMRLARLCGLPTPYCELPEFLGEQVYMVERFDRDTTVWPPRRIHTEDLVQAMGLPPQQKYGVGARQVVDLLRKTDPTE